MEMLVVVVLVALMAAGVGVGVASVLRRGGASGTIEADPASPRVVVEVHAGEEQVLIHLARTLLLPSGRDDVGYGEVYIAGSAGSTMRLASRSEIGRGFDGEVRVHRTRRSSVAEYFVLQVPGDEAVQQRIVALDQQVVGALRSLDPAATVRRAPDRPEPLRRFAPTTR